LENLNTGLPKLAKPPRVPCNLRKGSEKKLKIPNIIFFGTFQAARAVTIPWHRPVTIPKNPLKFFNFTSS
jgi:hypothetical protein